MPNHFHFILEISSNLIEGIKIKSVSSLIGALKTTSAKIIY
jgi:REP element-mobilizing transposase RayT